MNDRVVEVLGEGDLAPVAAAVAAWQRDPVHHVCYVGDEADEIADEWAEEPDWRGRTVVVRGEDGVVLGAVLAAVDEELGRVWWYGPWGVDAAARGAALERARELVPVGVVEAEYCPDARNLALAALARADGATAGTASSVLVLDPLVLPRAAPPDDLDLRPLAVGDPARDAVAQLHDQLFPGTHTTGDALVAAAGTQVRVASAAGAPVGYVATEVQAGGDAYVDYLGVAPEARRRGIARHLLVDALAAHADAGVSRAHLTVRHDATGARALYLGLGFVEERVIVPWRRGFDLA